MSKIVSKPFDNSNTRAEEAHYSRRTESIVRHYGLSDPSDFRDLMDQYHRNNPDYAELNSCDKVEELYDIVLRSHEYIRNALRKIREVGYNLEKYAIFQLAGTNDVVRMRYYLHDIHIIRNFLNSRTLPSISEVIVSNMIQDLCDLWLSDSDEGLDTAFPTKLVNPAVDGVRTASDRVAAFVAECVAVSGWDVSADFMAWQIGNYAVGRAASYWDSLLFD